MKRKSLSKNNIWQKEDFRMCTIGKRFKLVAQAKHFKRCVRWSWQRITRGYADCDTWNMFHYIQNLLPEMLQYLRDNRNGSPGYLGQNYTNEEGILVNDTCHEEWDKILDEMIFLWHESDEDTCTKKNPYEEEHSKALHEFECKYGFLGEKLQTEEELEENKKRGGGGTVHFMGELPEYKEIDEKYSEEERKIGQYRVECKDKAFDMLKEHFYALWD